MRVKIKLVLKDGDSLRLDIAESGHNVKTFSEKIGVDYNYLIQIANKNICPGPLVAKKIANGLGKKIEDYFSATHDCYSNQKLTGTESN